MNAFAKSYVVLNQAQPPEIWVALSIGNTHWKWGYFVEGQLTRTWKTRPQVWQREKATASWWQWCERSPAFQWHQNTGGDPFPTLYLASVVATEEQAWLDYPEVHLMTLGNIPMAGLYEGLGIDRALALWGAGNVLRWPVLVIDAGTALTFSGADDAGFQGGAIAPGVGLQFEMLHQQTAALPQARSSQRLPPRWAQATEDSICSGVLFGVLAAIQDFSEDWLRRYPNSKIALTGGDGKQLAAHLNQMQERYPTQSRAIPYQYLDNLIFQGMACAIK
ncbi:MAG: pantothenate kinase [Cyanobacteria bacterium P01_F01_bin.42]